MGSECLPVPPTVVNAVENYVSESHRNAARYDNLELLDDSGVYSLHALAARIYAEGFSDGENVQRLRDQGQRLREREVAHYAEEAEGNS